MRDATGKRLTLDERAAVIDPPSEGSQLPPGIRQYLRILDIYGNRSTLNQALDTTTDAAGVRRALDELGLGTTHLGTTTLGPRLEWVGGNLPSFDRML